MKILYYHYILRLIIEKLLNICHSHTAVTILYRKMLHTGGEESNIQCIIVYDFMSSCETTTIGSNFVLGGGLISQGRLLGHYLPLKLYRLSLVYKLLGGAADQYHPPLTLLQTCGINLMFIQCICSSTVYSPITLYQHNFLAKVLLSLFSLILHYYFQHFPHMMSFLLPVLYRIIKTKYLNN
jgi:hypothetical protein